MDELFQLLFLVTIAGYKQVCKERDEISNEMNERITKNVYVKERSQNESIV